ncbi:putative 2-dehydropantoate 2-reductase [Lineolata rhizophorae]|uniref:2-dehydropantoate 2-reductase n=1 Tax=Lineolata rhizophorae TaxID=578093 RepID=A0A6A6NSS2_9PEZI|nr:putative 2-dehydropantoate 2-reductase [Lineolata rhizophorae]
MTMTKARVLIVGTGGVGTMAAYALETGGQAEVTAVLRSNFTAVQRSGFEIDSLDHGTGIKGWKPSSVRNTIPNVAEEGLSPFDYVVVTTKNIPDIRPTVVEIIAPAVTAGKTTICMVQNGINIEKPIIERFPRNVVLSGISLIGATETAHGKIRHDDNDTLKIGPYPSLQVFPEAAEAAARNFVQIYGACGKVDCMYDENVPFSRWRKVTYNASFNSVATVLRMDTSRMRLSEHIIDDLILPAMREIVMTAKACGVELPDSVMDALVKADPIDIFFRPSMCQDIEKGNYIEFENIVGEPVREAEKHGLSTPVLKTIYGLLKGLQLKTKEAKGLWTPSVGQCGKYI